MHTKEPWTQMPKSDGEGGLVIRGADGECLGSAWSNHRPECLENSKRIVACVNALAGIEDPEAFVREADELRETASRYQHLLPNVKDYDKARGKR